MPQHYSRRNMADHREEKRNRPMADKHLLVAGYAVDTKDNRHTEPYPPSPRPAVQMAFQ